MRKFTFLILGMILVGLILVGCTGLFKPRKTVTVVFTSSSDTAPKAELDPDYVTLEHEQQSWTKLITSLKVRVSKFSYQYSTGPNENFWATPTSVDVVIDLVSLTASELSWLSFSIPEGAVIRGVAFEVVEATLTLGLVSVSVTIPGDKKVIRIPNLNWKVDNDGVIELSFDVSKSIRISGSGYILIPCVGWRWRSALRNLWAIHGTITINGQKPNEPLFLSLFQGADTNTTPIVIKFLPPSMKGKFYLGKFAPGTYTLVVYDNISISDSGGEVSITGREATKTTFEHGKESAETNLSLNISK